MGRQADVRPINEQTVLVTGATDGLGRALAGALAQRGVTVLVHGRSEDRLGALLDELDGQPGGARAYRADLSRLDEVRGLAEEIGDAEPRLDCLVCNAGIGTTGARRLSADGIELRLAVNHLAHFLLVSRLLDLLRRCVPARIVNVASAGQAPIDFADPMIEHGYDGYRAYAQSKLAQISFTFALAERLRTRGIEGVTVNALHPATLMDTRMVREGFGPPQSTVAEGLQATLRLVGDPDLDGVSGRYFNGRREADAHPQAHDPAARERLWELSARLTEVAS
jgi:NAD(P)-dependent dehydrogenase (short-subunit alcohol dehydrogenase family)